MSALVSVFCQCSSDSPSASGTGNGGSSSAGKGGESLSGSAHGGAGGAGNEAGSESAGTSPAAGRSTGGQGEVPGGAGEAADAGAAGAEGSRESSFILGADISSVQEAVDGGSTFVDTDGKQKGILEILKAHGFNYVRLRSFVDPSALYGYANPNGEAQYRKRETYCDTAHTLAYAKLVKAAKMGFLLDLHYSDNWADPGKQIIPTAWRSAGSIAELAQHVKDYTQATVKALVDGGARPDMVQVGNEITPGVLIHVPSADPQPDQWGNISKVTNSVNGSTANWSNLAALLKAGVDGVKLVDPSIKIMLHVENTQSFPAVRDWVQAVRTRGVNADVLGLSCYTAYQGQPSIWEDTFAQLASALPDLSFVIAEYNPERTRANEIMHQLPNARGLGTFFWEPTLSGTWGNSLFTQKGAVYTANQDDFAEFDALKSSFGL